MAVIKPIKALRFTEKAGSIETCVCPPYDIISPEEREALVERNQYNLVRLELPVGEDKYAKAGELLNDWRENGIIDRDEKEGIFVYREEFNVEGVDYCLTGLVCKVKLCEFSERIVLPHEETLTKAKTDRFNLMSATGCNFSSIYSLYNDESGNIAKCIEKKTAEAPLCRFTDEEEVTHTLWKIDCEKCLNNIINTLADKQLFIADGHHRYETALNFKKHCYENGKVTADTDVDHVMMTLVDMDDKGLVVFPTHRLIVDKKVDRNEIAAKCAADFNTSVLPLAELKGALKAGEKGKTFALYTGGNDFMLLSFKPENARIIDNRSEAYSDLDVSVLHSMVLENALGIDKENMANQVNLRYTRSMDEAIANVQSGKADAAFLINATKVSQIKAVALAGDKMPQKSTYFYPKLKTGLVMNLLKR
ncbi:MAG: DUF1015 domain-containing protein [Clostridia bacterium]|nr:DUF1015 domain-containing protein [Clostridia bacterium]